MTVTIDTIAAAAGLQCPFSVEILACTGQPDLAALAPHGENQAFVAFYFQVAPSTITSWVRTGLPIKPDGTFNLAECHEWVLRLPHPPQPYTVAAERMKKCGIEASGMPARALLRWISLSFAKALYGAVAPAIVEAFPNASEEQLQELMKKIDSHFTVFEQYTLNARGIEDVMTDLAALV